MLLFSSLLFSFGYIRKHQLKIEEIFSYPVVLSNIVCANRNRNTTHFTRFRRLEGLKTERFLHVLSACGASFECLDSGFESRKGKRVKGASFVPPATACGGRRRQTDGGPIAGEGDPRETPKPLSYFFLRHS
ncbi:hypothetical protein V6Z11_A13G193800 [Gossypium hirsutum]